MYQYPYPTDPAPQFQIRDTGTLVCELCDRTVPGRIRQELYGGALMLCEPCHALVQRKKSQPYSRTMSKFALRATGYLCNVKMARASTETRQPWLRYG